jgi:hypothetical protein
LTRLYGLTLPILTAALAVEAIPTIPVLAPDVVPANGIVAAADGTVYFIDTFHDTVWRIQPGGAVSAFLPGRGSRSLQIDGESNLYGMRDVADGRLALWRADPTGFVSDVSPAPDRRGYAFGAGVEGGLLELAERRPQVGVIGAVTRTPGDDLIITAGAAVRRICPRGIVTTVAAGDPLLRPRFSLLGRLFGEREPHLTGVAVAANGDVLVANAARGVVVRVTADGDVQPVLSSDPGWTPSGVATAGGQIYVLEYGRGVRVRRLTDAGSQLVLHLRPPRPLAWTPSFGRLGG